MMRLFNQLKRLFCPPSGRSWWDEKREIIYMHYWSPIYFQVSSLLPEFLVVFSALCESFCRTKTGSPWVNQSELRGSRWCLLASSVMIFLYDAHPPVIFIWLYSAITESLNQLLFFGWNLNMITLNIKNGVHLRIHKGESENSKQNKLGIFVCSITYSF